MLRNYVFTIFRQIRKNRDFSFINVVGLAISMAACLIIAQYIYFHHTFDDYHPDSKRIFRIHAEVNKSNQEAFTGNKIANLIGEKLDQNLAEVQATARFYDYNYPNNSVIVKNEKGVINFEQPGVFATNKGVFDVFQLPIISGSIESFDAPQKAIMTTSTALKYFESPEEAIGKAFTLSGNNGAKEFELIAIIEDLPQNTHLGFQLLISIPSLDEYTGSHKSWTAFDFLTYVKLQEGAPLEKVLAEVKEINEKNSAAKLKEYGYKMDFKLMPLTDIHLYSKGRGDFKQNLDYRLVYALTLIAVFILIIAWINYLNLSLVKTLDRLKEVGIRKTLGSSASQINALFIIEAITINIISFLIALTIAQLIGPWVEQLTEIRFDIFQYLPITGILFLIILAGSLLIGFYPAVISNTVSLTKVLVGGRQQKVGGIAIRQVLVTLQFVVTFLLVCATLVVYQQITYMKNAELGFDKNNVMVIKSPPGDINAEEREDLAAYNAFRTELLKKPGIEMVTNAGEIPGEPVSWRTGIKLPTMRNDEAINTSLISMGLQFPDFLGLEVIAGRGLKEGDSPWTKGDVIINEKLAMELGFEKPEDAIGAKLEGFYAPIEVRGVVNNHHHTSLHNDYAPTIFVLSSWTEYYFIKFDVSNSLTGRERYDHFTQTINTIETIEAEWNKAFAFEMDYFFLDEYYNIQYREDERFGRIFSSFSILAIFIACLGLFGLTSFTLKQRTKEIGIRKVLGAGFSSLILLLSKNYLIIILISYAISMPVAWIFLNHWLENYTFRISLDWWLLIIPLVFVVLVAAATILSRMLKAAWLNPVDSLRYE